MNKITGQLVRQNSQEFIIGVFNIGQILKFTKYTKRLIVSYNDNGIPEYNEQVQREVETGRVERIADFLINDPLASFPTNIVLGIPNVCIESMIVSEKSAQQLIEITLSDTVFQEIQKENGDVHITIIDGQHRVRGIEIAIERLNKQIASTQSTLRRGSSEELSKTLKKEMKRLEDLKNIELSVSFFLDPSLEFQAMIFSTINRTQKRVSQNLVNSLFGLDVNDTPQKSALEVTLALNVHSASPFYKRINLYGGSYDKNQSPPLSQATMIKSIVNLISENTRESENDRFKKRNELLHKSERSNRFLPFRYFYSRNQDKMISDILFFFFNSVRKTFQSDNGKSFWDMNSSENILQTTVGYQALLKVLCEILEFSQFDKRISELTTHAFYLEFLLKASDIVVSDRDRYPFSTRGSNVLYHDISLRIFPSGTFKNDRRAEKLNDLLTQED